MPEIAGSTPVRLARGAADAIRAATVAARQQEACGLLFRDAAGTIVSASVAPNIAARPERFFEIAPAHLFAAHRGARAAGLPIAGCWHSHPNGRPTPSRRDAQGATDAGWLWLIVAGGVIRAFQPESGGFRARALAELDIAAVAPPLARQ